MKEDMKEVILSLIGAIGLGSLIKFFIKRHDKNKEKHKRNLVDFLKIVCAYNQVLIDYLPQQICLLEQKTQKLEEPLNTLSGKVSQQKQNVRKLKKLMNDCTKKNIRNCEDCCRLQEICHIHDDEIEKTFTQIETVTKEQAEELTRKIIDTREKIRQYNGLLNRPVVSSIKFSKLHSLLSELDLRTVKILIHEPNESNDRLFYDLLVEQHTTINKIKVLINRRLS